MVGYSLARSISDVGARGYSFVDSLAALTIHPPQHVSMLRAKISVLLLSWEPRHAPCADREMVMACGARHAEGVGLAALGLLSPA